MAVITVYGKTPDVGSAAFVAPNATLAGDVVLAAGSSVWYGAVVRGDTALAKTAIFRTTPCCTPGQTWG